MKETRIICVAVALAAGLFISPSSSAQTIVLEPVVSGLTSPVYVTHAGDGSGRLFIVEQPGVIRIFDGTQLLTTPFLDISSLVSCCNERGLFSMAFHPDYQTNGYFYVDYTDNSGDTVVARYEVSGNPNVADPSSAFPILGIDQPAANHNGGQLQFGPDGYLYIGMGDGGGAGDPNNNAQTITTLLGKMLRIDVDSGSPYGIPPDNPYVGIAGDDEIWATGLRNPWRFSFDRLTGDMFIGDVGQGRREEIDFQAASSAGCENWGWRRMEGSLCFNPSSNCQPAEPTGCNPTGAMELPILEYSHTSGRCSVTGGYRYRGSEMPSFAGQYFYADYCAGHLWAARKSLEGPWVTNFLMDTPYSVSSFGEDEDGELYVVDLGGAVYRLSEPSLGMTVDGSCPGDVTVTVGGAPPNSEVALVAAANNNGFTKGGSLCNGVVFEIGEPFVLPPTFVFVDANGNGSGEVTLPANRCWLEALAFDSCQTSNAQLVP